MTLLGAMTLLYTMTVLVFTFIFKMKSNMIPEYLMKNVSFVKNRTSRLLRNQNDFDIKRKNKLSN